MARRPHQSGRRAGLSLVEVMIGTMLFVIIGGSALVVGRSTEDTSRAGMTAVDVDGRAGRGLQRIGEVLRNVQLSSILPAGVTAPFHASSIRVQHVIGYDSATRQPDLSPQDLLFLEPANGEVDDGVDNDGDGLVDEKRVVLVEGIGSPAQRRRVLVNFVRDTLEGEIAGNGLDDNGNGLIDEPGFCVVQEGSTVIVRLSIERMTSDGSPVTRTMQRRIRLRNDG